MFPVMLKLDHVQITIMMTTPDPSSHELLGDNLIIALEPKLIITCGIIYPWPRLGIQIVVSMLHPKRTCKLGKATTNPMNTF
jgi:hypothetical protein